MKKEYKIDLTNYSFIAEEDWGDYFKGKYRKPWFDKNGYSRQNYKCTDGKWHSTGEHRVKWIYFNGEIPDGMTIDHIIPVKNGGTNKLSNLRLLSLKDNCNNPLSISNHKEAKKKMWNNNDFREKMREIRSSEEWKMKASNSHKGQKGNIIDEQCKKVYQYKNNELVAVYFSIHNASNITGFNRERIKFHCNDGKTYKGYRWSFEPL